jgi:hypothetical protein
MIYMRYGKLLYYSVLAEIRAGHEFTSDNSLPLDVAKVFLSECEYARSKNLLADYVGNKIKETILPADEKLIPIFLRHLSHILTLNPLKIVSSNLYEL